MLSIGTKLGPYEVVAPLGAGGMGEVYRARDTALNRDVALKILPDAFASDPDRVARFTREAQALAALNHPHIAQVYGLDRQDGPDRKQTVFIAMELVDGETLAQRIARGPISLDDALAIARQVVDGLEAAHEKGIVHRDLKPANIALTADGQVKILDFGLAKFEARPASATGDAVMADLTQSPTLAIAATGLGVILGTAGYMSPEQAKGRAADKRSDVWAFGCVLFEMLTGRRAFAGEDISDTLAAVLRGEPDWKTLPAAVPEHIRRILELCLDKDRRSRIPDMSVVRFMMADTANRSVDVRPAGWPRTAPWALAAVLGLGVLAVAWAPWRASGPRAARPVTRFSMAVPGGVFSSATSAGPIALSPDGTHLVYSAQPDAGARQLYVRSMDSLEAKPLAGTLQAGYPFFSPDGQWVGFVVSSTLKKVAIGGGPAATICECTAIAGSGFAWAPDDSIVLSTADGLARVPAAGGGQTLIARVAKGELMYRWPDVLPGGTAVIVTIQRGGASNNTAIGVIRLDTSERRVLFEGGTHARYLPDGRLIFARDGALFAAPFDLATLSVTGGAVQVVGRISMGGLSGSAQFAVSRTGNLAYVVDAEEGGRSLAWVGRDGGVQTIDQPPQNFEHPRLSPDGQQLAVDIRGYGTSAGTDIWLYQFARGTLSRLTFGEHNENEAPAWTPDGTRVTYAIGGLDADAARGRRAVAWKAADGSGVEEILVRHDAHLHPASWSARGDVLMLNSASAFTSAGDIWALTTGGTRTLRTINTTPFAEVAPSLSPDGHWLVYASNETGRPEVYAQAYPALGSKTQISVEGGTEPVWAHSGREIFYRSGDKLFAVSLDPTTASLRPSAPTMLFQGRFAHSSGGDAWYDVSADGRRFLMLRLLDATRSTPAITVVQEWSAELDRTLAPKR